MIVDWLHDPIKSTLLHVDFKRIDLTRRLSVKVPVHFQGDPEGVKTQGGLFELVTREIEIECLPDDIPEHFTVDVSPLLIGQNLRAADVKLNEGVRLVGHGDTVLCHVVATRGAETAAEPAEAAAAPAEPEVIKKGKKEEEGETKPKK
jgi:large subunit ribosomal protein L25